MQECLGKFNNAVLRGFYNYGFFLGQHPIPFMVGCVVICAGLSVGLVRLNPLTDLEELYAVEGSRACKDRAKFAKEFPDVSSTNFNYYALPFENQAAHIIFRPPEGKNILETKTLQEVHKFLTQIKTTNVTTNGRLYTYEDLCAMRFDDCVFTGDYIFSPGFLSLFNAKRLSYPYSPYLPNLDMSGNIGRPVLSEEEDTLGMLIGAGTLIFRFPLRTNVDQSACIQWVKNAVDVMKEYEYNETTSSFDIAFSSLQSLTEELDKSTRGDVIYFIMTFALMIAYAFFVSSGGNMVSTRALLSFGGVLATGLGIVSSLGVVTLAGVRFVNQVGVMPYLLLGVGVDDMFLLMSAWSETTSRRDLTMPDRIGRVFKKAGIGITITSVTNFLSFGIGATTRFRSVRNFCLYTGIGVVMCYFANVTFFGGCMTLHGKRIYAYRHTLTCRKVTSADKNVGHLHWFFCGGSVPQKAMDDQSVCEKGPSQLLPRLIMWKPLRVVVIILFAANIGVAIWGCTKLKQGMDPKELVLSTSFVYKYEQWSKDFGIRIPVSFVKIGAIDYRDPETLDDMTELLQKVGESEWMTETVKICWLTAFAQTPSYVESTEQTFVQHVETFLRVAPHFVGDVVITNGTITASRCHMLSKAIDKSHDQGHMMDSIREITDKSPAVDFPFQYAFIFFENFQLILPTTVKAVVCTVVVMSVVTAFFLPHPLIVLVVIMQVIMIVVCIFGYMAHWDLKLSSITMVHLIMSAGLSVDFCAHVCTAYMVSEKKTAEERAAHAVVHASGPILNGGTSSVVGLCGLLLSDSYIFQSFFKVMFLVVGFGVVHAVFFVPAVLSFLGPRNYIRASDCTTTQTYRSSGDEGPIRSVTEPHEVVTAFTVTRASRLDETSL